MDTLEKKKKMHEWIDSLEDKRADAIYTLFEGEIEYEEGYTDEFKAELEKRRQYRINGGKMIPGEEVSKRVRELLNEKRK